MGTAGPDEIPFLPLRLVSSSSNDSDSDYQIHEEEDADLEDDDLDDMTWDEELNPKRKKTRKAKPGKEDTHGCHYCRKKQAVNPVYCSRCTIKYCRRCLRNRNGENIPVESSRSVQWVCPRCRGGCGPGCKVCCTCVPCRKTMGLEPAGHVLKPALDAGFTNVHDFLVYLETGEAQPVIARRKDGRGWTSAEDNLLPVEMAVEAKRIPAWGRKRVRSTCLRSKRIDETLAKGDSAAAEKVNPVKAVTGRSGDGKNSSFQIPHDLSAADGLIAAVGLPSSLDGCGIASSMQSNNFRRELELLCQRPFSLQQLQRLWVHFTTRRPSVRLRQNQGGNSEEQLREESLPYLDHYPDLAAKLARAILPQEKLKLLRGFFFWVQKARMDGAYKPWVTGQSADDDEETEECMEIGDSDSKDIDALLAVDAHLAPGSSEG